ncbi:uncharacterized protein BJX67DRAFT_387645 [Aspergillus lucknowensis]|uniref:Aminoglycoside phosphotransferase domain-containing protein n=1 Tax=Aspergillus lucknowensis TaxID=176173 RepID=A0ABR4LWN3_9EURO
MTRAEQTANIVRNPQDFFRYTSGRWVWDESKQLQERYREFNILELQQIAMQHVSYRSCVMMEKLGEGSYNKSFKLTMGNGKIVIARIPNPNAGPAFLTTASEVATMDFLRNVLHVPAPEILVWSSAVDSANPVGAEYIIMEHAAGKNLAEKLLSIKFSRYGCVFYTKDAPLGSRPARVDGDKLSTGQKNDNAERFSVGPMVDTTFWTKGRGDMEIDRGPWIAAVEYIKAFSFREICWIQKHATPHWQSTCAGPLFLEGRRSHFLDYHGDLLLELPENFKQLDADSQTALRGKLPGRSYYTSMRNPILFVGNTWDGDVLPLRESLIRCPTNFSPEEISKHSEDGEGWNEIQDFWDAVSGIMGRDGWTSHATYDQALCCLFPDPGSRTSAMK